MSRIRLLLLLAVAAAGPLRAQQPAPPTPGTGILDGEVRDTTGRPLLGATVTVLALDRTVLSDSTGRFRIDRLPTDTLTFAVRRVGYAPAIFGLAVPADTRVSVAVKMKANAQQLGTVVINGERRDVQLQKDGFYDRKRQGFGTFMDAEFLAKRQAASHVTSLLREAPAVQIVCAGGMCSPIVGHGPNKCAPTLWLDGVRQTLQGDLDLLVYPSDIKAIEVYVDGGTVPGKFMSTYRDHLCGAVVIWTKWLH